MHADFWHERWQAGQIGFHEGRPNALLSAHLGALDLAAGARIFLPLCGKTRDIAWLLSQGHRVAGAELSAIAVRQLFEELEVAPTITGAGPLQHYAAPGLDIFVGDVFELTADRLGPVDAVLDRAAYVALPGELRPRYAAHIAAITGTAPQLLITFEYDQSVMPGPPFAIPDGEAASAYAGHTLTKLDSVPVAGKLKGQAEAMETIWHLEPV